MGESLGVDIGGVIVPRVRERDEDTALSSDFLETQPIPEAFEVLRQLVDRRFGNRVFIVSKAGPRGQVKTRRWLKHHRFYAATGIKPKHVHFCLERHHKAGICEALGITHFIDDRLEVLQNLRSVPYLYLFRSPLSSPVSDEETRRYERLPKNVLRVSHWQDLRKALLPRA